MGKGDREARALGAGDFIEVQGKEYKLYPVVAGHLAELERRALRSYKRDYIETFSDNADLLPGNASELIKEKLEEAAKWTPSDLPQRIAFDCSSLPVTDKLKKWIEEKYGEVPQTDNGCRSVIMTALDAEEVTPDKVKAMTGARPRQGKVRYDQWWVTATITGMLSIIKASMKDCSEKEKEGISSWSFPKVAEAARIVERLTSVALGNG